jgi:ribonucleoside-triphosphate reductase
MGCRAFLSPYKGEINNPNGGYKFYGRFNMGLTSINLADAGLSAQGDMEAFWDILEERLELCYRSLLLRYNKLKDVTSDVSPIHWQYGALARLGKHEPIYPLLQDGYATITLGYIGLYECVKALIGVSHTTPEGEELALKIMKHLKKKVVDWKKKTGLGFALYGTPSESLTDRFARLTKKRWGEIEGITDRLFLTNSYHVFVEEPINAYDKLKFESQFHSISSGGAISYIEVPNMGKNIPAVIDLIQFMYENVQYAEFNTKLDFCQVCGFEGEVLCDDDLEWYCPNCGNRDTDRMNIVRRTCGYLGENLWNQGRTSEIKNRVLHLE